MLPTITKGELTFRSGRTLPTRAQSSASETLLRIRSLAGCTIGTLESSIRKRHLWLGVTAHPTADWIAQQLTEAYGWTTAPRYVVRDRDAVYGATFIRRLRAMGIRDRPTTVRSPWQNGCAERLIGSIRRECVDNVVVFGERHLRHP